MSELPIDRAIKSLKHSIRCVKFTKAVLMKCERIPLLARLFEADIRKLNSDKE